MVERGHGALIKKCLPQSQDYKLLVPPVGAIWGCSGGMTLLEDVCHCGWFFRAEVPLLLTVCSLCFVFWLRM